MNITTFKNNGIAHLEDLHYLDFITTIKNLSDYNVTEKLDGANLVFGFDKDGNFYTSRESKKGVRYYNSAEFEDIPQNNMFRSAHLALENVTHILQPLVGIGHAIEVEVLFGIQPNAIIYGLNYIVFLRRVPGDCDCITNISTNDISDNFKAVNINVQSPILTSRNGLDLTKTIESHQWKITHPQTIDINTLLDVNVNTEIKTLELWLNNQSTIATLTNAELLQVNLNTIPKNDRPKIKQARTDNINKLYKFKTQIKHRYVTEVLNNITPALQTTQINQIENVGIEGIVLQHKKTLQQIKIVDKNNFTTINSFYYAVRNKLKVTNLNRPQYDCINLPSLDTRDIYGVLLQPITKHLNLPPISYFIDINRMLKKYKGITIDDTIHNLLNGTIDFTALQSQTFMAIQHSISTLISVNNYYCANYNNFFHILSNGKTISYNEHIHNRTLLFFAELYTFLHQLYNQIAKSNTEQELINILFKKQLNSIHKL